MSESEQSNNARNSESGDNMPVGKVRRMVRVFIRLSLIAIVVVGISTWVIYASAQKEPEFYKSALAASEQSLAALGDQFEKQALDLQNDARTKQHWQAVFTPDQINGWLASDFPKEFPGTLPRNVSDPRIGIQQDVLRLAFRFHLWRFKFIVQAEVDAFCTEVPGQIAIRIKKVRSGFVPIPVNSIADRISMALGGLGATVEWTEIEGDPVALIGFSPDKFKIGNKQIAIESIQLLDEELVLVGSSVEVE